MHNKIVLFGAATVGLAAIVPYGVLSRQPPELPATHSALPAASSAPTGAGQPGSTRQTLVLAVKGMH